MKTFEGEVWNSNILVEYTNPNFAGQGWDFFIPAEAAHDGTARSRGLIWVNSLFTNEPKSREL